MQARSKTRYRCYWSLDWTPVEKPIQASIDKPKPGDIVIRSKEAKRVLADHLRETSPALLAFLKAMGEGVGPMTVVMEEDEALLGKLRAMKGK